MSSWVIRLTIAVSLFTVACIPPKRPPTYVAQLGFEVEHAAPDSRLDPEATAALASATTVAFSPPDDCPEDGCGMFMARLERAAIESGLRVISWQSLRGPERAIDYARDNGADVLFELNALRFGVPAHHLYRSVDAAFFDEESGRSLDVGDPAAVARRCIPGTVPALRPDLAVVLDLKMSSVDDGRVLWTYRTTRSGLPPDRVLTVTRRFKATSAARLQNQSNAKIGFGIASVVVGAVAALATSLIDGLSGDEIDFPSAMYLAEAMVLGTGIYLLATSNSRAHWGYSTPEQTLCVPDRLMDDDIDPTVDAASSTTCTASCRQRRRLADRVVRELFSEVNAARSGGGHTVERRAASRERQRQDRVTGNREQETGNGL